MAMRKPFYLRFIDEDDSDKNKGGGGGGSDKGHEHGFPKDTPLVEMTTEQREAYWKFHARKHEGVANARADYDQLKALADKWRDYENSNKTPDQKAIDAAAENARKEERAKAAPRIVKAEFKAAAAGNVPKELLDAFLEDVNPLIYLKEDGELDAEKIQKRVDTLAPKKQQQERKPTHQGYRPTDGVTSVTAGRDLFSSRNKKG